MVCEEFPKETSIESPFGNKSEKATSSPINRLEDLAHVAN